MAFLFTIFLSIIGTGMYGLLPLISDDYPRHLIFIARLIIGLSTANVAISRSYIVSATFLEDRTATLVGVAAAQASGFIIGPVIQSGIIYAFEETGSLDGTSGEKTLDSMLVKGIPWNMYSAVGYVGVLLGIVNFIIFLPCIFKDQSLHLGHAQYKKPDGTSMKKPDYSIMILILFAFFVLQFIFSCLSSLLVPFTLDFYAYSYKTAVFEAGIMLSVLGVICLVMFIIVAVVSKKLNNDKLLFLFFGFIPMIIGIWLHFPIGTNYPIIKDCATQMGDITIGVNSSRTVPSPVNVTCSTIGCPPIQKWCFDTPIIEKSQLITALMVTFIGYAVAFSLVPGMFSKLLGPTPQGLWMGILTSIGGLSRICGPLVGIYIYTSLGPKWLVGLMGGFTTFICGILLFYYKRFTPYKY